MRIKALVSTLVVFSAFTGPLQAADTSDPWVALDTLWVLIAAFMVFFMQAGFGMVEAGLIRSKNAGNILMKNMMSCGASSIKDHATTVIIEDRTAFYEVISKAV